MSDLRKAAEEIMHEAGGIENKWAEHWLLSAVALARDWIAQHPADDSEPITVDWLHAIAPAGWRKPVRGIDYANWSINSVMSKSVEPFPGYDVGPFVWTVKPTHFQNLIAIESRVDTYAILVLRNRGDVRMLLRLLEQEPTSV